MVSVHVGEDARCGANQRIRSRILVLSCLDPSHHAKAPHVVKVDGLEPEKTEVGEVDPITAVLVTCKVNLSNRIKFARGNRFGKADQSSPSSSKRIAIGIRLYNEETASRFRFQVLSMHCHIANQKKRPARRVERERHKRSKGKPRMPAGKRRQGANRSERDEGAGSLSVTWFSELRRCRTAGCVLAGAVVSFEDIGFFTFRTMLSRKARRCFHRPVRRRLRNNGVCGCMVKRPEGGSFLPMQLERSLSDLVWLIQSQHEAFCGGVAIRAKLGSRSST